MRIKFNDTFNINDFTVIDKDNSFINIKLEDKLPTIGDIIIDNDHIKYCIHALSIRYTKKMVTLHVGKINNNDLYYEVNDLWVGIVVYPVDRIII